MVNLILNNDYNGILINDDIYNVCSDMVDTYTEIISILDILESDLNTFHNVNADELREYFD